MRIAVVVTPRASHDSIEGWKVDDSGRRELSVHVTAAPEGGRATKAVCETLAKALKIPKSSVSCARGATSRHKQIDIDGPESLLDRLS